MFLFRSRVQTSRFLEIIRHILKEIMAQHTRDAPKQFGIYMTILKDFIHIRTVTMDVLGKPCDGTPLSL